VFKGGVEFLFSVLVITVDCITQILQLRLYNTSVLTKHGLPFPVSALHSFTSFPWSYSSLTFLPLSLSLVKAHVRHHSSRKPTLIFPYNLTRLSLPSFELLQLFTRLVLGQKQNVPFATVICDITDCPTHYFSSFTGSVGMFCIRNS
jgi:hypothetical protein